MRTIVWIAGLGATLLLAACSGKDTTSVPDKTDPLVVAALADPLLTDLDLNTRNPAGEGLYGAGPVDGSLPPIDTSKDEIEAAREEAAGLLGGTPADISGPFRTGDDPGPVLAISRLAGRVAGGGACTGGLSASAIWAARLAPELAVYPRAHVTDSVGADNKGCALRVVRFVTPVAPRDIIAFYHARLQRAGHAPKLGGLGDGMMLSGGKAGLAWRIEVRKREGGLAEVALISLEHRQM